MLMPDDPGKGGWVGCGAGEKRPTIQVVVWVRARGGGAVRGAGAWRVRRVAAGTRGAGCVPAGGVLCGSAHAQRRRARRARAKGGSGRQNHAAAKGKATRGARNGAKRGSGV